MKLFRNALNYDHKKVAGEINDLPSQTVPDMTPTLPELLKRHTRGMEVPTMPGTYQEGDDFDDRPDVSRMDAVEKLQYAADIKAGIAEWQKQNAAAKLQAEADKKAAIEAAKQQAEKAEPKPSKKDESNNPT